MNNGPSIPRLLTGHPVKPPTRCLPAAVRGAATGRYGAADVVWSRSRNRAELALVLEPEVPLSRALHMLPLTVVALGEALGALSPPQAAITWRWPGEMRINGGRIGAVTAVRPACAADAVPDWLVIGIDLALAHDARRKTEPGHRPDDTALLEEGFTGLTSAALIGKCLHHFLVWLDTWQDRGFRPVSEAWLFRADGRTSPLAFAHGITAVSGRVLGLDEAANLVLQPDAGPPRTLALADHVEVWSSSTAKSPAAHGRQP